MYQYDLYKQDGTIERIGTFKEELAFGDTDAGKGLYSYLNCSTIEMIPEDYLTDDMLKTGKNVVAFGDEEGRFNSENHRNPHFKVLGGFGQVWDVVGNVVVCAEVRS